MFSLPVLERQLVMYVTAESLSTFANPFDLSSVPIVTREQSLAEDRTKKLTTATPTLKAPSTGPKPASRGGNVETAAAATAAAQKYAQQLQAVPELASYGGVLKSSAIVELTESETEYVVSAVKHLFKEHVVLQFDIKNTLPDTILADVTVVATPSEGEDGSAPALEEDFIIPAPQLKTDEPGTVYVSFKRTEGDLSFVAASFTNVLKFTSKEIDPTTGEPEEDGYEDEYQVEDLELTGADYVIPAFAGSFDVVWEQANGEEASETLQLSNSKNIAGKCSFPLPSPSSNRSPSLSTQIRDATESLIATLSLQPVEGTEVVLTPSTHTLRLYGKTVSGGKVAAQVRMAFSAKSGVTMKIDVRAEEEGVAALMIGGVS
ncbi:coatomer subunit gamma [Cryomyces antarcticus]|nr:coatomer subunit gamma [Cryomyces antarcticus]